MKSLPPILVTGDIYQAFVENAIDGLLVIDAEGIVRFANPAARALFADRTSELLGFHLGVPAVRTPTELILPHHGGIRYVEMVAAETLWEGSVANLASLRDITDRKIAEGNLKASERRFRSLIENASDLVCVIDARGCILFASPSIRAIGGYTPREVIGKNLFDFLHSDDFLAAKTALSQVVQHARDPHRAELRFRHKGGSSVVLESIARNLLADSAVGGIVINARDVTEQRRSEGLIRESELRYRTLFTNMLEGYARCKMIAEDNARLDCVYLEINPAFESLTGLKDVIGKRLSDLIPGVCESNPEVLQAYARVAAGGPPERIETYVRALDTWFQIMAYSAPDNGFIAVFDNITERKRAQEALAETEQRFRQLAENIQDVFFLRFPDSARLLYVSPAYEAVWGRSVNSLYADPRSWFDAIHPDDRGPVRERYRQDLLVGQFEVEYRIVRPDGSIRWIESRGFPVRDDSGNIARIAGVAKDVTERKLAEISVRRLNRVYAVLSGINSLIVRVRDRDELFHEACWIATESGGFRMSLIAIVERNTGSIMPVAAAGKDAELRSAIWSVLSSDDAPKTMVAQAIREKCALVANDSQSDSRLLFGRKYAESGVRSLAVLPLLAGDEALGVLALYSGETGFFDDEEMKLLTELAGDVAFAIDHIDKRERLDYLAYYDVLTGLANRSLFAERVAQYMRSADSRGHKLALFLIDLERFKNINDSLGRPAGDALLRQVAEWLTRSAGDVGMLARLDADHFAVVLPEIRADGNVTALLEKLIDTFQAHPFQLSDAILRIAAKVGVALFPDDGRNIETLFRNAEAALKKAKASGVRYLFYTQKMSEAVADKLTLENQLRQALDENQFVLHYQPKVHLASGELTGAEALIRWNDPRTGLVAPGRFIPVLEETGLIYDVGRWALRKAVQDYLRWRSAGLPAVRIAVNVSPLQLRNRGFIDEVRQVIGIDAQAAAGLELEITESLIMEDVKHSIASLQAIRAMGVSIAIDDFGTGFSSLSYLARLPVHTLKIDRSFVIDMTAGPEGLSLVSTIINLAHSLKLEVVAEGVETEEQSRLLRLLNCDQMQGYLFSRPLPSEMFETKFLASPQAG